MNRFGVLVLGLGLLGSALPASAQSLPVELRIVGADLSIGSEFEVEVAILDGWTIIGTQIELNYDAAVVEPVSIAPWTEGSSWTGSLWEATNEVTQPGMVRYASIDLSEATWPRTAGAIAVARFRVIGTGAFTFTCGVPAEYDFPVFLNELNELIPVELTTVAFTNEAVEPAPDPDPTPAPTPAPSPAAGAPATGGGSSGGGGGCSAGGGAGNLLPALVAVAVLALARIATR